MVLLLDIFMRKYMNVKQISVWAILFMVQVLVCPLAQTANGIEVTNNGEMRRIP